jgi:hypothetical protein
VDCCESVGALLDFVTDELELCMHERESQDGIVEISAQLYQTLVGALKAISQSACCRPGARGGVKHDPTCPIKVARAALMEARKISSRA